MLIPQCCSMSRNTLQLIITKCNTDKTINIMFHLTLKIINRNKIFSKCIVKKSYSFCGFP